jgi:hypothetical protein
MEESVNVQYLVVWLVEFECLLILFSLVMFLSCHFDFSLNRLSCLQQLTSNEHNSNPSQTKTTDKIPSDFF